MNTLPVFKLLQAFKLQQYAKALAEMNYGYEIYKLSLLSDNQKFNILNKLNLMPGHRARFTTFFESVAKICPQEERSKSLKDKNISQPAKPAKKRTTLLRRYKALDNNSKQAVNDQFLNKILKRVPLHNERDETLQNLINKHSSEIKKSDAVKAIFPPELYEKYGVKQHPKFGNRSFKGTKAKEKARVQSSKVKGEKFRYAFIVLYKGLTQLYRPGALSKHQNGYDDSQRSHMTPTASLDFPKDLPSKVLFLNFIL